MNGETDTPGRGPTQSYRELVVWQRAHQFVLDVYRFTASFPSHELFGLTGQLRRAAVSVAANIAEGYKRRGSRDKSRFLNTSQASLEESSYFLILARDLNYGEIDQLWSLYEEVAKLLHRYEFAVRPKFSSWLAAIFPFLSLFHP